MNYKFILAGMLAIGMSMGASHATCQTISFTNGESFCFDIRKTNSDTFQAQTSNSKLSSLSSLSCSLQLPNGDKVKLPKCEGSFRYSGNDMKIELYSEIDSSYHTLITNYDFRNGQFSDGSNYNNGSYNGNSSYYNYQISLLDPSTSRPSRDQRVDLTLRVRDTGTSYQNFYGQVDLSVEEYRNGSWQSAYSSDYRLENSSYNFTSSENGERRLYNLLRFYKEGEYKLIAKIPNTNISASQTFYVNGYNSSSNSSSSNDFAVHIDSKNPNNPARADWIDIGLRFSGWSNYQNTIEFSVEEYRNGGRYSAYSSDYDLERTRYSVDRNESSRTFNRLLRFHKNGEFRLVISSSNGDRTYGYFTITNSQNNSTRNSNTSSNTSLNYTLDQWKKLNAVASIWQSVITSLKKDYPKLRNSRLWISSSDTFYTNMQRAIRGESNSPFNSRNAFYQAFQTWLTLTVKTR